MSQDLRKSGITSFGDIPWGSHFCQFYESKNDLLELLIPYFKAGLENNEYCLWLVRDPVTAKDAIQALRNSVSDFDRYLERKSVEVLPHAEWFLTEGKFNPNQIIQGWNEKLKSALARGYDGMRVSCNEPSLEREDWENVIKYERELNRSFHGRHMIVLCTYSLSITAATVILDVAHAHEYVISKRRGSWDVLVKPEIRQPKSQRNGDVDNAMAKRTDELGAVIEELKTEIGERKKVEIQLIRERELSNQIFNSIPAAVTLIDQNFRFIRWNKIFEKFAGDGIDKPLIQDGDYTVDQEAKHALYHLLQEIVEKGFATRDITAVYINNEPHTFHVTGHRIAYENKPCILCVGVDVTERKKVELQFAREKELSNEILDSIPGLVALFDENMKFVRWNKGFEVASGYAPEDIPALHGVESFYDNEDDKKVARKILKEMFERGFGSAEVSPLMKDGTAKTLYFNGRIVEYEGRRCLLCIGIDISERKKAEVQVIKEKELSNEIIDSIPGVFTVLDENFRFIRWNKNVELLSGFNANEIPLLHAINDFYDNEDDRRKVQTVLEEAFEKGSIQAVTSPHTKNGVRTYLYVNARTIHYEGKRCIICTAMDISDRKQAEERLRQSESLLAEAEHLAHVGSWSLDLQNKSVTWSDELYHIFGVKRSEFDHSLETVIEFSHPDDKDFIRRVVEDAVKTLKPYGFYYRMIRPTKEERILHVSGAVMTDEQGNPIRMYGAVQDVTEGKKAEETLRQSYEQIRLLTNHLQNIREEERTRIAREIHDELGQKLTVMKMDVAWLIKGLTDDNAAIQTLQDLTDLLDATLQSVRRISTELRPSLLDDLGLNAAMEWHLREFEKRSDLKTKFNQPNQELPFDDHVKTAIFRIFQESLTNVARHAHASHVKVDLVHNEDHVVLKIKDDGQGFDKQKATEGKTLGILGMRERAESLGWHFEIQSSPEKGTKVLVTIPFTNN